MSKSKSQPKNKSKSNTKKPVLTGLQSLHPLQAGDIIDIVAPGSSSTDEILQKALRALSEWGLQARVADDLIKPQLYLSNTDEYRFESLKKALEAKDSKAVWCLRGGYGSLRLLPLLDKIKKPKTPKLLIGFSDITSLQIYFAQKWGWPSLHGPLIDRLGQGTLPAENRTELRQILFAEKTTSEFKLKALNSAAEKVKSVNGEVLGGNLMVAVSTLGTKYQISGDGRILFFEELSERGYRIDRCLQQLHQAGVFSKARAVVLGEFTKCNEPDGSDLSLITLYNFFEKLKIPAFHGFELGHGTLQRPLFFKTPAKLTRNPIDQSQFQMLVYSPYEIHKPRK